jgi:hypothetical protein
VQRRLDFVRFAKRRQLEGDRIRDDEIVSIRRRVRTKREIDCCGKRHGNI